MNCKLPFFPVSWTVHNFHKNSENSVKYFGSNLEHEWFPEDVVQEGSRARLGWVNAASLLGQASGSRPQAYPGNRLQTHLAAEGYQGLGEAASILDPQLLSLVRMSGRDLTRRLGSHT